MLRHSWFCDTEFEKRQSDLYDTFLIVFLLISLLIVQLVFWFDIEKLETIFVLIVKRLQKRKDMLRNYSYVVTFKMQENIPLLRIAS